MSRSMRVNNDDDKVLDLGLAYYRLKQPRATMGDFIVAVFWGDNDDAIKAKEKAIAAMREKT